MERVSRKGRRRCKRIPLRIKNIYLHYTPNAFTRKRMVSEDLEKNSETIFGLGSAKEFYKKVKPFLERLKENGEREIGITYGDARDFLYDIKCHA